MEKKEVNIEVLLYMYCEVYWCILYIILVEGVLVFWLKVKF